MPIIPSNEIVLDALHNGYAVPAINTQGGNYEILRACIEAAYEENSPIILQVYPDNTSYYGLDWIVYAAQRLIREFDTPVAIHLDHGKNLDVVQRAIECGFSSVMLDFSDKPINENIEGVNQIRKKARRFGVTVEAEIGTISRAADAQSSPLTASIDDVARFLEHATVDMLAVAIGNAHGHYKGEPNIDVEFIKQVRVLTSDLPLVLHGATGIPDSIVKQCVHEGMAKVNFGTGIREKAYDYSEEILAGRKHVHYWQALSAMKERLKDDIRDIIHLLGSNGAF